MKMQRVSLSLLAVGTLLAVASCDAGEAGTPSGAAGKNGAAGTTGVAGMNGGAAGMNGGAAGDPGNGAAGDPGNGGAAGDSGGAGNGGAAGMNGGTAGTSGAAGSGGGVAGSGGGVAGSGGGVAGSGGGAAGTGGGTPTGAVKGMSEGCGKPAAEASGKWNMHQITIPVTAAQTAKFGKRVYYIDLPTGYDPAKPYPILFGGAGCGGADNTNASSGGFAVLGTSNPNAIQVGLGYIGGCFSQGGADNPEMPFFDAVLKEVEAGYCVDKGRVFVGGYSSGGWLSYMLAFARGGVVRGISPAAGGIAGMDRRPPDTKVPVAGLLLTGANDTANPATGATGSDVARDMMLMYNGCQGTATVPWETACPSCACVRYTGCPAAYPVVRCRPPGQGHTDGGGDFKKAIWTTWMSLPTP
jgi:poly(3-hydroxybutyrate) depolymerase